MRRRTFAAPFVVTLALAPAATADAPKPPEPAKFPRSWTVTKSRAKTAKPTDCIASRTDACPPVTAGTRTMPCNPPKPMPYTCPTNAYGIGKEFTAKDSLKIVLRANTITCVIDEPLIACEPGEKCNPPPPRKIACPQ